MYDRGAYVPKKHYYHFVESLASAVTQRPGCAIFFEHEVAAIESAGGRVTGVRGDMAKLADIDNVVTNAAAAVVAMNLDHVFIDLLPIETPMDTDTGLFFF